MMTNKKFTDQQLEDFRRYEAVRVEGLYNMFTYEAKEATGLNPERFVFVMKNYSALKSAVEVSLPEDEGCWFPSRPPAKK